MKKKCRFCKKEFYAKNISDEFCSKSCKQNEVFFINEAYGKNYKKQEKHVKKCPVCDKMFSVTGNQKRCYCSEQCSKEEQHNTYKSNNNPLMARYLRNRFEIFMRDNFACQYCGRTARDGSKLVIDHITPKARGGKDTVDNLITACSECNSGKGDILLKSRNRSKLNRSQSHKT